MAKFVLALAFFLLLVPAGVATAQQGDTLAPATVAPQSRGTIDFGGRFFDIAGDRARDQRYRDLRSGPTFDRLRYTSDQRNWFFNASADHVGYRDQRYLARFADVGKAKLSFEWNQIPL